MTESHAHDDDGYDGPAELIDADGTVTDVEVSLRGAFEPISGSYRWYGRVAASDAVARLAASTARTVVLRTPHGEVTTALTDLDPWNRPRVEGFGSPPFPVVSTLDEEHSAQR